MEHWPSQIGWLTRLSADDAQLMWDGMAIQPLRSIPEYCHPVESGGFRVVSSKDMTEEWGRILQERLAMYQRLREEADKLAPQRDLLHSTGPTFDLLNSFKNAS